MHSLANNLWVSGPLTEENIIELAHHGVKRLVCNRPDGEEPGQLPFATVQAIAQSLGMETAHLPMDGLAMNDDMIAQATKLFSGDAPTVAYCRTGRRSTALWCVINAPNLGKEEVINKATALGYDLSALML